MDQIFEFLYSIRFVLHTLAGIAIITKMFLVFRSKGFNLPAYVVSFFRVYTSSEKQMSNNPVRQRYMKLNNTINFYLYVWVSITLLLLLVYQKF